jgi:hypothetical protein
VAAAGGDENRGREREYQLGQGQTAEPGAMWRVRTTPPIPEKTLPRMPNVVTR